MKISLFPALAFLAVPALFAAEHPIRPNKDSLTPASFIISSQVKTGVTCVKNDAGTYVIRMDAADAPKQIYSGIVIPIAEGDTCVLKLKVKGQGVLQFGFNTYDGKRRYIKTVCEPNTILKPDVTEYSSSFKIEKNPQEKSAFDRPNFALVTLLAKKDTKVDIEKIEYEIQKKAAEKAVIPEF